MNKSVKQFNLQDAISELLEFRGKPAEFLNRLLLIQLKISSAKAAMLLRIGNEGAEILAVCPPVKNRQAPPPWLEKARSMVPSTFVSNELVKHEIGKTDKTIDYLIYYPLKSSGVVTMEVFYVQLPIGKNLAAIEEKLHLCRPLIDLYESRLRLDNYMIRNERVHKAFEMLIKGNLSNKFLSLGMSLCNEIAAGWNCSRVSLGILKGRYVRIYAMSHTEKFNRKMKMLQDLEAAMEECLDQDMEVVHPQIQGDYVGRAATYYSSPHGPSAIMNIPIRYNGKVRAVLRLERNIDEPFTHDDMEIMRLSADLMAARLLDLYDRDRWIGAKLGFVMRDFFALLVGAKYTWAKCFIILLIAAGVILSQAKGMYKVDASFRFNPEKERFVVAPFEGTIQKIYVKDGDQIDAGDRLIEMNVNELILELASVEAEFKSSLKEVSVAMNEAKTAEAQIAQARADQHQANIKLLNYKLKYAVLYAPLSGTIISNELEKKVNPPVKYGESLLSIVKTTGLEALIFVPEEQIADVRLNQVGELAAAGHPELKITFTVIEIAKVAEVLEGKNVFRIKAKIAIGKLDLDKFKPGMEGIAKIDIDQRLYVWIWTREAINWVRMKLWI